MLRHVLLSTHVAFIPAELGVVMRILVLSLALSAAPLCAQPELIAHPPAPLPTVDVPSPPAAADNCCTIPAGMIVAVEIGATLSSQVNKPGDKFPITLVEPIKIGDLIVVPVGAVGQGEVIHTAKKGGYGRAGEMLLAARYLDYQGSHIPLRSLGFAVGHGKSGEGNALAVGFIVSGILPYFMTGGEMKVETGTKAFAKISTDLQITDQPAQALTSTIAIGDKPK
jgi:hypothetical protein